MKKKLLTGLTGVAAAVVLAGVASTASAAPIYAIYEGDTTLTSAVGSVNCRLLVAGTIDPASGAVLIKGAGSVSGDPTCAGIYLGNFPWTGNVTGLPAGPGTVSLNTTATNPSAPSVLAWTGSNGTPLCGGAVSHISYSTVVGSPALPASININPSAVSGNFGGSCTITGTLNKM